MWQDAHDAYLESRVLSADPIELVKMLYQTCIGAVQDARRHLAEGEIAPRARSISRACEVLTELITSLDHERGGEYSQRLAQLYDYMQRRLLEANFKQTDAPLEEVLGLLATLAEGWEGTKSEAQPELEPEVPKEPEPANPWAQPPEAANPWAQPPEAASPWAQPPEAANPWAQPPEAASPWTQPPEPANPWAQPPEAASPWGQPLPPEQTGAYTSQAWSF